MKCTIIANAAIVTSSLSLNDILTLQKYSPESLILKDEQGEPVFRVAAEPGTTGSINQYGATFGAESRDAAKLATLTMAVSPTEDVEDIRELVADKIGTALVNLQKLEQTLPQVLQQVTADRAAILNSIQVIG